MSAPSRAGGHRPMPQALTIQDMTASRPPRPSRPSGSPAAAADARTPAAPRPLDERELDELQRRLDALPAPLEPLDVSMLDGYLCGVLLQPQRIPESAWWPHVCDADGRPVPGGVDVAPLQALVRRRHAELDDLIERRQWFDPWVYELDEDASPSETVMPWVAGFATACAVFPRLMELDDAELLEPLAALYMHLDPEDLEDADELLAEIETLEPPAELSEAVEALVSSTLLLADVSRPVASTSSGRAPARRTGGAAQHRGGAGRGGAGGPGGREGSKGTTAAAGGKGTSARGSSNVPAKGASPSPARPPSKRAPKGPPRGR